MKKLFFSLLAIILVCSFVACQSTDDPPSRKITMNDADWLYENIPSSAKAGEPISVKINKAYDLGYLFLVNGKEVEMADDADMYWQFTFPMPDEDVEIDFKTYDGFLPEANYGTLIETFWLQNLDAEYVNVREYYGEYDDGAIVAMIDSCDYTANIWCEEVAGMDFMYGDGNRLLVLKGETFHTLTEAYDKGVLSGESIENLFRCFFLKHSGLYTDTETTVKVTRPDLTIHTGPGYDNEDIGTLLDVGTYTITEHFVCDEGITWGKLKSGVGWIDLIKAAESLHIPITLERIKKEALNEMDCHLYLREETEYTQYLLLQPYEPLTDVKLCFMDFLEDGFQPGETLYSLDILEIDKPLVLGVVFYGDFTTFGLTFTDAEGIDRQYMIYESGRNGSIVLQEKE